MMLMACLVFCLQVAVLVVHGQELPIPKAYDGFWYTSPTLSGADEVNERNGTNKIFIEAYYDPLCPDSR